MRKLPVTFLTAAAVLTAVSIQTAGPAAAAPAAAAIDVLTYGAPGPGGPNVVPGQTVVTSLPAGGTATFLTAGGIGTTCKQSNLNTTVTSNPPVPGVALAQINTWTFGSCGTNIPGVGGVISVTVNNLPNTVQFSDAGGLPVTIVPPPSGPLQVTILESVGGAAVPCVWQPAAGVYNGNYINGGNQIVIVNQQMKQVGGPAGPCAGPTQFFSVTYRPVQDASVAGAPPVFVN